MEKLCLYIYTRVTKGDPIQDDDFFGKKIPNQISGQIFTTVKRHK